MNSVRTKHLHEIPAIARQLRALFERLPALAGFRVRTDLVVAEVSAVAGSDDACVTRLHVSAMRALVELAECHPETLAFVRGRTFARPH